jgi:NAD(P)-dependent dehydrogenase (short-subunit alcohol dehydrogenase family)
MSKILITGASGSIGGALALKLAESGAELALHYHKNNKRVEELAGEITDKGGWVMVVAADLSRPKKIHQMIEVVGEKLGGLDVLVHCAASFGHTAFAETNEDVFDEIMDTNLKGIFFLAQAVAEIMPDKGRMIFFSDAATKQPYTGYLPYCMSKAALETLVRGLAKKLAPKIMVNALAPYLVTRPPEMTDEKWTALIEKIPAKTNTSIEEVAEVVSFLIKAPPTLTGQIITLDGGRMLV